MDSEQSSYFGRYKLVGRKHEVWSETDYAEFTIKYNCLMLKRDSANNLIRKSEEYVININPKKVNDYTLRNKFYKLCGLRYSGFECNFNSYSPEWGNYVFIFKILNNIKLNYAKVKYGF